MYESISTVTRTRGCVVENARDKTVVLNQQYEQGKKLTCSDSKERSQPMHTNSEFVSCSSDSSFSSFATCRCLLFFAVVGVAGL